MRFSAILVFCILLLAPAAAQPVSPGRTLLFLDAQGALRMANITEESARIPDAPLAPGKRVRRFAVSPDGTRALLEVSRPDGLAGVLLLELATRRQTSLGAGLTLPEPNGANPFAGDGRRVALCRQRGDEVAVYSTSTGRLLQVLSVPGLQGAPVWFGDAYHLAVVSHPPEGGTRLAIFDVLTGAVSAEALKEETPIALRYEGVGPGLVVFRETRDGLDGWLGVRADGAVEAVDEPVPAGVPADLPQGVEGEVSPGGEWV
ncbi:MAG: hypothetical protein QHJ73_07990, partial [Armatimonadota bacterium]|nr:hypothetical protein [Armatimonadota bacterium]